jgi:hypothetical protein
MLGTKYYTGPTEKSPEFGRLVKFTESDEKGKMVERSMTLHELYKLFAERINYENKKGKE